MTSPELIRRIGQVRGTLYLKPGNGEVISMLDALIDDVIREGVNDGATISNDDQGETLL